jgi:hypothetical protein
MTLAFLSFHRHSARIKIPSDFSPDAAPAHKKFNKTNARAQPPLRKKAMSPAFINCCYRNFVSCHTLLFLISTTQLLKNKYSV